MKSKIYETHDFSKGKLPVTIVHNIICEPQLCNVGEDVNWHEELEIWYCDKGSGEILLGNELFKMKKGEMCVINSNTLHSAGADECFSWYCIIINSAFLEANGIDINKFEYISHIKSPDVEKLFLKVVDEIESDNNYKNIGVCSYVLNLMLHLIRNYSHETDNSYKAKKLADEGIKRALGFISVNYSRHLSLEEVADYAGLSKYYFAREFKKVTGLTFITYLNLFRCRVAKRLLALNKYQIHEVAQLCGFENDSYFSKKFLSITGYMPSEYAKLELPADDKQRVVLSNFYKKSIDKLDI